MALPRRKPRHIRRQEWLMQQKLLEPHEWRPIAPKLLEHLQELWKLVGRARFKAEEVEFSNLDSRSKYMILKRLTDAGALFRVRKGHYVINPCYLDRFYRRLFPTAYQYCIEQAVSLKH